MVDALMYESVRTLNPALARKAAWLWWNDASAYDMGQGYGGITRQVGGTATFPEIAASQVLEPGDFAVTADGSHVMAWAGDGRWIEADPVDMRVETMVTDEASGWGNRKGLPCRWRWLEK